MRARLRTLCLLATISTIACARAPLHHVVAIDPSPTSPPEPAADDSPESRIQARLRSLMRHPWSQWRKGATIVRGFVPHGRGPGIDDYLQPELTYEIIESGKRFERRQEVNGKVVAQSFSMHPEDGLPKPFGGSDPPAAPVPFELDGATVPSLLRSIDGVTHGELVAPVTKQWTLARDDGVLLRRETGAESWWVVKGLDRRKTIDGRVFLCVEVEQRIGAHDNYVLTTTFLSPEVPGHVVEEMKEYYDVPNDGTPRMVTVERALRFTP